VDSASRRPSPLSGRNGGADPKSGGAAYGWALRWARRARDGLYWLFLIFYLINQDGCITKTTSVKGLTEVGCKTTSVKTTINYDLRSEVVAKTALVNGFCPPR
jgi:hypothetical protein